jgi:hypothetical protein
MGTSPRIDAPSRRLYKRGTIVVCWPLARVSFGSVPGLGSVFCNRCPVSNIPPFWPPAGCRYAARAAASPCSRRNRPGRRPVGGEIRQVCEGEVIMELEALLPCWRSSLVAAGRRPRGVRHYLDQVRGFTDWLGPMSTIAQVTTERITAYQEWKAVRCSPGTVGNALAAIRSFCRWMIASDLLDDDPTAKIEWPKRRKRAAATTVGG